MCLNKLYYCYCHERKCYIAENETLPPIKTSVNNVYEYLQCVYPKRRMSTFQNFAVTYTTLICG